ncbi:VCBS repeat-containing protein [bacterium]|nr:VCBS repeat-containing protein [bacterium]
MKKTVLILLICLVGLTFAAQRFNNATGSSGTTMPDIGQSALFADIFPPFGQGYHDLVAVSDWGSDVYLFSNDGDGTFTREYSSGVTSGGAGYYTGDYNNDGFLDLFRASISGGVKLYENNGDGTLTNVAGAAGVAHQPGWNKSC